MIGHLLLMAVAAAQPGAGMASIDLPYQMAPAFFVYVDCVSDRFAADHRAGGTDLAAVEQANRDAIAACREVRETQLARSLELVTDYRPYGGSRSRAQAAVRRAFDTFDHELVVEPVAASADPSPTESRAQK